MSLVLFEPTGTAAGITVKSFGYTEGVDSSLVTAIENMATLGLKVGLVVLQNGDSAVYLKTMMATGLMGGNTKTFFIHTDTLSPAALKSVCVGSREDILAGPLQLTNATRQAAEAQTDTKAGYLAWQGHARIYAQGSIPGVAGYEKYLANYLNGATYGAAEIAAMNTMIPSIPIPTNGAGWSTGTDVSWTPAFPANFFTTATAKENINDVAAYLCELTRAPLPQILLPALTLFLSHLTLTPADTL